MTAGMSFIRAQIREIADDSALQIYGAALALVNALTSVYWLIQRPRFEDIVASSTAVCWPFLPHCERLRVLTVETAPLVTISMGVCAAVNAWMFVRVQIAVAWWILLGLTAFKGALLLMDYRLLLNQHYMALWIVVPFLLVPGKRRVLRYLLALFYLWAGTLKLNHEWLSGLALYGLRPLGMPAAWVPWACLYVVFLELLGVFGLFARRHVVFALAFGQFLLFHVASFWVVGFFYPILMFLLLSIFPLTRAVPEVVTLPMPRPELPRGYRVRAAYVSVVSAFCLAQLVPLAIPGDSSITGEGRAFALHMFDAPVRCVASITFRPSSGLAEPVPVDNLLTNARLACDPIVYYSYAQRYCQIRALGNTEADIDLLLQSRKENQDSFRTVVSIRSFCRTAPRYSGWRRNTWITP